MATSKCEAANALQRAIGEKCPESVIVAKMAYIGISATPTVRPDLRLQGYAIAAINSSVSLAQIGIPDDFKAHIRPSVADTIDLLRAAADLLEETIA